MAEDQHGHSEHPSVHLPDPSPWPIIAGLASLLFGAALVWWARDADNEIAAVALGAAAVLMLVAVGGWSFEDARMRRKAEAGEGHDEGGEARYNQVLTFAIAEGQLETARGEAGVLTEIDSRDSALRDLAGFQDLRIVVSPADTGPSQVLVETTWASREGLASYEETKDTLLDILTNHEDEVVPGSVQVFDMEVVRDTKDVAVRFGLGAALTMLGTLAIGGFFVGAGLTLFEGDGGGEGGGGNGGPVAPSGFQETGVMVAENIRFADEQISLPPGVEFTMTLDNRDGGTPHNIEFFPSTELAADQPRLDGCIEGCGGDGAEVISQDTTGPEQTTFTFTTPGPGEYAFWCIYHTNEMRGTLTVAEDVPLPGGGGNGGGGNGDGDNGDGNGGGAGGVTIAADNLEWLTTEFTVAAGSEVNLTLDNQDNAPHNLVVFEGTTPAAGEPVLTTCTEGCDGEEVETPLVNAGEQASITFTAPDTPGEYAFYCAVHPAMTGVMLVE